MSKNYGKLARRYAKALLRAMDREVPQGGGSQETTAQQLARSLQELSKIWQENAELSNCILNPMFEREQRAAALARVVQMLNVPETGARFVRLVFERERIIALPQIVEAFQELADNAAGMLKVEVVVAREIAEGEKREVEASVLRQIKSAANFTWKVEPEILGGIVVRYGGKVLDGSLQGRLARVERVLLEA